MVTRQPRSNQVEAEFDHVAQRLCGILPCLGTGQVGGVIFQL